jgi:NDP-sugar pyrophosphorylase family protein
MKAMIFAAGLGTRLRPLTDERPKALVEVKGMPLLEIAIRRLKYFGCREIIVNIHHFGEQILDFLERKDNFGIEIAVSDERDLLLDTGGGLKKASWFLKNAPFLLCNADVLTTLDLKAFYETHLRSGALATLAVLRRPSSRYLLFDAEGRLSGWRNVRTGERKICRKTDDYRDFSFSGIHAVNPALLDLMPPERVFSIIDVYLSAGRIHDIRAYPHDEDLWQDVGRISSLHPAEEIVGKIEIAE